jgi:hypoxanthine-DNA glycosylase
MSTSAVSFPPVAGPDALVLILGSMPGERSLEAAQYYAHARNAFWPIMDALFGIDANACYSERLDGLVRNRVALWDVLRTCDREGSLDTRIRNPVPNDFNAFFADHAEIRAVFCNGRAAHKLFTTLVVPQLLPIAGDLVVELLPSTSPANARLSLVEKTETWRPVATRVDLEAKN